MTTIPFAIVGDGWRARFYLRVAAALPDRFRVTGRLTRRAGETPPSAAWAAEAPIRPDLDALLADRPMFVVLAVPGAVTPVLLAELAARHIPVLAETPPADDLDELMALRALAPAGARIQVAEQYRFQPLHAARLAIVGSGRLGAVSQVQVSVAHGFHGIDLLRRFLRAGDEPVTITARRFRSPVVGGPDRSGPPPVERLIEADQLLATFDFGDRLGILDFTDEQYFSWIRGLRLLVRGERGEIDGRDVRWLLDGGVPARVRLARHETGQDGNLEGMYLEGVAAGAEWLYRNPFIPARLSDDEIAVATCLDRMPGAIGGGPDVCSLADAVQDRYLDILMERAAATGLPVRAEGHPWRGDRR